MFSSFSTIAVPNGLARLWGKGQKAVPEITLESVDIHEVETAQEKRARTLKHLIKLNHVNHAVFFHHRQYHNHLPHFLGSAYLLGASSDHLQKCYDHDSRSLVPWEDSPGEISRHDWRDYLGDARYERAYVDFFEDELVLNGYDWRKVVEKYLFSGKNPIGNCLVAGLGHPLIHLGYAYELSSRDVAMEALSLAACSYNFLHKYLDDDPKYRPGLSTYSTSSPLEILQRVRLDKRLDGLLDEPGAVNAEGLMGKLFEKCEAVLLEHFHAWELSDPRTQFRDSQHAAAAVLVATYDAESRPFDFFLMHVLSTSHAVRILLPLIPAAFHIALVKQWWLLTLTVYISQLRPEIRLEYVTGCELQGKDWRWVDKMAVKGKGAMDVHHVKALRGLKEAAKTWGDDEQFYLKAAVRLADNFTHWGGFGSQVSEIEL
ncbi:hypothetical protein MMC07_007046 [Pseudocyphellaria aurata]|nr:hypothetical protein [Pseudocyphellaria aurata]